MEPEEICRPGVQAKAMYIHAGWMPNTPRKPKSELKGSQVVGPACTAAGSIHAGDVRTHTPRVGQLFVSTFDAEHHLCEWGS